MVRILRTLNMKWFSKKNLDSVVLVSISLLIVALAALTRFSPKESPTPERKSPAIGNIQTLVYKSPNKVERSLDTIYSNNDMAYSINRSNTFYDAGYKLQYAIYTVSYESLVNQRETFTIADDTNMGCIAANNQSFQQRPDIFSTGGFETMRDAPHPPTSLDGWRSHDLNTLNAYQENEVQFAVNGTCQYLGTKDGQYWWKL